MSDGTLPFPRGETHYYAATSAATSTGNADLVGREFDAFDNDRPVGKGHGTGQKMRLKVVRNDSGVNLNRGRGVRPTTASTANAINKIAGYVNAAGGYGYLIDDAMATGYNIVDNDLFYVVLQGPCSGSMTTNEIGCTAVAVGDNLSWSTWGYLRDSLTTEFPAVRSQIDAISGDTGQPKVVNVGADFGRVL